MEDIITKARVAKRESRQVEFKSDFDPNSDGQWCEVIKDIVAISNSGGGVIVFGVNDDGSLGSNDCQGVSGIDHADLTNRFAKYTGCNDPPVEIVDLERDGKKRPAFLIQAPPTPLVFGKPGTYNVGSGQQKCAFGQGTIYFRHGAKSETGTTDDVRTAFERRLTAARERLLKHVKRVVRAPVGAEILVNSQPSGSAFSGKVHAVKDPNASRVVLTRDTSKASGTFLHEEVSEEIFDEINNVIDANRVLSKGRPRFFLGAEIYYRVYAERSYVRQPPGELKALFRAGACEFYAPNLYWGLQIDPESIGRVLADIYIAPKGSQIHWFMRTSALLGATFCDWLLSKWERKWRNYSQPPAFYFSFKRQCEKLKESDGRLVAARISKFDRLLASDGQDISPVEMLKRPVAAEALLSTKCLSVFEGNSKVKSDARALDCLAYGEAFASRAEEITDATIRFVGDQEPGDLGGSETAE